MRSTAQRTTEGASADLPSRPNPSADARAESHGAVAHVVAYLYDNRLEAAFGTTRKIAAQCGVSNATVVRASQWLGYRGFRELREALRTTLRS